MSYEIHHIDSHKEKKSFSFSGWGFDLICQSIKDEVPISDQEFKEYMEDAIRMGYLFIEDFTNKEINIVIVALSKLLTRSELTNSKTRVYSSFEQKVIEATKLGIRLLLDSVKNEM